MQSYNATNIKSLEGYDIAWVEEAQTLSPYSLEILRPTLRKEGSELWFSWNPRTKVDAVDKFFRKNPPAEAISIAVNWRDNRWFPDVLRKEMKHDFEIDPDRAEHIWNGAYGSGQGAILAKWVHMAEREGRINDGVDYDPYGAPIEISSDIGFRDTSCWWFWQRRIGGFTIFDYDHGVGLDADDWIERLRDRIGNRKLGRIWLPPDAKAKTFQSKNTSMEKFLVAYPGRIGPIPPSKRSDQVGAARTVIGQCEFNKTRCEDGLDGLQAWEYEWNEDDQVFSREPKHDWASHRGQSYAYGCQVLAGLVAPEEPEPPRQLGVGPGMNTITMNDAWETQSASSAGRRI
jgi:phage terminase large subunit